VYHQSDTLCINGVHRAALRLRRDQAAGRDHYAVIGADNVA